jgi:hypothetical protein
MVAINNNNNLKNTETEIDPETGQSKTNKETGESSEQKIILNLKTLNAQTHKINFSLKTTKFSRFSNFFSL